MRERWYRAGAQAVVPQGAGFVERFIAYLIDIVILIAADWLVAAFFSASITFLLWVLLPPIYFITFWQSSGQTPGKSAMGLRVVDARTGGHVDTGNAILRYIGYIISAIPFYLGFLWVIWDSEHEAWHDKIAKTRVINVR